MSVNTVHLSLDNLVQNITLWAEDRNLIEGSTRQAQFVKLVEELGELANAIAKDKPVEEVADALGDMFVVMTIIAEQSNINMGDSVESVWNTIKNRNGVMIDGIFVKDSDL